MRRRQGEGVPQERARSGRSRSQWERSREPRKDRPTQFPWAQRLPSVALRLLLLLLLLLLFLLLFLRLFLLLFLLLLFLLLLFLRLLLFLLLLLPLRRTEEVQELRC